MYIKDVILFYGLMVLKYSATSQENVDFCDIFVNECNNEIIIHGNNFNHMINKEVIVCKRPKCSVSSQELLPENDKFNSKNFNVESLQSFLNVESAILHLTDRQIHHLTVRKFGIYGNSVAKTILASQKVLQHVKKLDLAENQINATLVIDGFLTDLSDLNLSDNNIKFLHFTGFLPSIQYINLSSNSLQEVLGLEQFPLLNTLDLANNKLSPIVFNYLPSKIDYLSFQNNPGLFHSAEIALTNSLTSVITLVLTNNNIRSIEQDLKILNWKFNRIENINLSQNHIRKLHANLFPDVIYQTTASLSLYGNEITSVGPNTFRQFRVLEKIDLTENLLQHLPVINLPTSRERRSINQFLNVTKNFNISLQNNPWSCDCFTKEYHAWIINANKSNTIVDITCQNPESVAGRRISELDESELFCVNASIKVANVSSHEFTDAVIWCNVSGAPLPIPYWITPENETISAEDSFHDTTKYTISPNGQKLIVHDMRFIDSGFYRCIADNEISQASEELVLGIVLAVFGTVTAIVASSFAFLVAMVLNLANLFCYMADHLKRQREKRHARKKLKEEQENLESAKLREKEFYESAASLNANRYYNKYDFTCQQMFLDTVVKGAHTVKKTIYDAKNSEFSNNMWGYASYLRDRLHIELPSSVQLPRVSMPTISMPNISIPSFQGINTNIEKTVSNMKFKSHKIGTSVGSVFTLRWLRNANSSDQSSDECEAGPSQTHHRVKVHVHHHRRCPSDESSSTISFDDLDIPLSSSSMHHPLARNHRRTKSVRFYKEEHYPPYPGKLRRTASYTVANTSKMEINPQDVAPHINEEDNHKNDIENDITVVSTLSKSVHEFETCL